MAEWSQWSDRTIAGRCGLDHKTVAALRPASGEIPQIPEGIKTMDEIASKHVPEPPEHDPAIIDAIKREERDRTVADIRELVARTPAATGHGGKRAGAGRQSSDESPLDKPQRRYPKQTEQRIARLKRDFPLVAEDLAKGKFPSVAAAWRAARLEKPRDAGRIRNDESSRKELLEKCRPESSERAKKQAGGKKGGKASGKRRRGEASPESAEASRRRAPSDAPDAREAQAATHRVEKST